MAQLRTGIRCVLLLCLLAVAACGQPQPSASPPTPHPPPTTGPIASAGGDTQADLSAIKTYLLDQVATLKQHTAALKEASDRYYDLARGTNFDYARLWSERPDEVREVMEAARAAWIAASPGYERIEGIVAGVPTLANYDLILDAGSSAEEDPENAVPFDLTLPDGRVLPKPGNLFGVTESALWGTFAEYTATGIQPDLNGNGKTDFGDALPDANVLKAASEALDRYTAELATAAQSWQPSESDAFTALVVMIPTMSEYFASWKNSRFVAGEASTQRDFVAISRLADIQDILSGLQVVYVGISPLASSVDPAQDQQIKEGLSNLKSFVADVYAQEQSGKRFTPEEADLLGAEAQARATAIAGQITQVAARLNVPIQE
jgi:hypothetical protein